MESKIERLERLRLEYLRMQMRLCFFRESKKNKFKRVMLKCKINSIAREIQNDGN
jgi:hypothetical protein